MTRDLCALRNQRTVHMSHSWRKTKWTRPGVEPPPPRPPPQPPPPRPPPPRPSINLKYVAPGVAKPADSSSVSRSGNLTYVAPGVEKPPVAGVA